MMIYGDFMGFLKMGDPQVTMGFNIKIVQFWMIWGTLMTLDTSIFLHYHDGDPWTLGKSGDNF
jgi:hypothetical protein